MEYFLLGHPFRHPTTKRASVAKGAKVPSLVLGLYVINGASVRAAWILFGDFTLTRLGILL
jgi:hypothetical protein